MATADRTFPHYRPVRIKLIELMNDLKPKPEKAGLVAALEIFIVLCDDSISQHGVAQFNTENAIKALATKLTNGHIDDHLDEFEDIWVRGQLNMAIGYYEAFYYDLRIAAR